MKPIKRSSLQKYDNITSSDEGDNGGREYLERYQDDVDDGNGNAEGMYYGASARIPNEGEGGGTGGGDAENQMLLAELRNEIQFWNKFMVIGNSILIALCFIILALELTTDLLTDHKEEGENGNPGVGSATFGIPDECLDYDTFTKDNDVESFFQCASYCSSAGGSTSGSKGIHVNSTTGTVDISTHNLASANTSLTTPTLCSEDSDNAEESTSELCTQVCKPMLSTDLDYFQTYVSSVCDDEKIHIDDAHLELCVQECSPFDCCFTVDDDTNCLAEKEVLCGAFFEVCLKVHENAAMFGAGVGPQILEEGN